MSLSELLDFFLRGIYDYTTVGCSWQVGVTDPSPNNPSMNRSQLRGHPTGEKFNFSVVFPNNHHTPPHPTPPQPHPPRPIPGSSLETVIDFTLSAHGQAGTWERVKNSSGYI